MKKVRIGFWGMDSVLEFVTIAGKYKEQMELVNGDCIVNAKSLLSVLSLVTAEAVELIIQDESCDSVLDRLDLYVEHGRLLGGKNIVF
ncbi:MULTISPECIES: HPr family phosphocarrier protein [Lacrimispora]|jgi:phosphocarrier protein|uniref:HPr family phosphocarrier protein n=1 Tax=Lacrimispora TaxID=2719231 RepID=UPI000BE308C7|nr:HPr family phosphocarrier protein [Lacrimispora amygdalina]MDK2964451.1 phosphocarrier protein HPr [Lacrimispora sp.]